MNETTRILNGTYELLGKVRAGGMGAVWKARHVRLGTTCVVKLLHESLIDDPSAQREILLLMQNDLLPLDVYDRRKDEARYYAACEEVRVHRNYAPFTGLIAEWEQAALSRWEASHGN